jgi:DNA-binding NarL/FixJ family response regulator
MLRGIRLAAARNSLLRAAIRRLRRNPGGDRLASVRLTERDREVPRFMTAGPSKLVVGVETVKTHVGNVLTKFGARPPPRP